MNTGHQQVKDPQGSRNNSVYGLPILRGCVSYVVSDHQVVMKKIAASWRSLLRCKEHKVVLWELCKLTILGLFSRSLWMDVFLRIHPFPEIAAIPQMLPAGRPRRVRLESAPFAITATVWLCSLTGLIQFRINWKLSGADLDCRLQDSCLSLGMEIW